MILSKRYSSTLITLIWKLLIGCRRISTNEEMFQKVTMQSKTKATMWNFIISYIRIRCKNDLAYCLESLIPGNKGQTWPFVYYLLPPWHELYSILNSKWEGNYKITAYRTMQFYSDSLRSLMVRSFKSFHFPVPIIWRFIRCSS